MKKRMKSKKLLIMDFDGTIADTKALYYHAIYHEVKFFGYSYNEVDKIIDLGLNLKSVLKKLGFSFLTTWFLHRRIIKEVEEQSNKIKKCRDVDSIRKIRADKILVSNSLKEFTIPILKHFKLEKEFREIYGFEDFSDKAGFIANYLKKNKIKKENCYYIGDRAADIKVAKKAKCRSVIISGTCAWDSRKEILKQKPEFILSSLADLNKIL